MTVKHVRQLQRQHVTQALSCDPTVASKYKAGFNECANEVVRYLSSLQGVDEEVRERLIGHLGNVVTSLNYQTQETSRQCSQPLNVQIPQHASQGVPSVPSGCLLMPADVQTPVLSLPSNSSVYTHRQTQIPTMSPVRLGQKYHVANEVCGSFQIVPSSNASGSFALYLGQSQRQPSDSTKQAIPLYSSHTPPRTKTSLKAFDESPFSKISDGQNRYISPIPKQSFQSNLDFELYNVTVGYGRTPSPLKVEDVWRPW